MNVGNEMNVDVLIKKIEENKIAIYGTGYVSQRFYEILVRRNLTNHLMYFITSKGGARINGYEVLSINDARIGNDVLILIAVHETIKDEIVRDLEKRRYSNYIWIYPELYELMLGNPIKENVSVPIKRIWLRNRDNYCMAVRYLAIDNYYKKNTYGYYIYRQAMSLYNSQRTSEKRLQQFIALIESWERDGYDQKSPSMILDDYSYIDGTHRISLASYFGLEFIMCNVYSAKQNKEIIHNNRAIFPKSLIPELNLDESVVKILEETNHRIDEQYDINLFKGGIC